MVKIEKIRKIVNDLLSLDAVTDARNVIFDSISRQEGFQFRALLCFVDILLTD
jgi:hypothetical protein